MCQCGCGDTAIEKAWKLPNGNVLAYQQYRGCRECFAGPGVSLLLFDTPKSEWLEGVKIQSIKPDKYGGDGGHGLAFSFFEVQDLQKQAAEMEEGDAVTEYSGYGGLSEWLNEHGLELLQGAMRKFEARIADLDKTAKRKRKKK